MNELLRRLLDLPEQASSFAKDVDQLHYLVIGATMIGSLVVAVVSVVFVIRYRRRSPDELTEHVEPPVFVEWTWIAFLLALFIGFWLIGYRLYVRIETPPPDAMEVYVTAKQWMWQFAYPDGRNSIANLTVPVGRPVRLNMTSRDVIHSFSVPAFRIKQDVIPGRYTTAWFKAIKPGNYQILCAEYCGVSHSTMWGSVSVLSEPDYQLWLDGNTAPPEHSMAAIGRDLAAERGCLACHTLDGKAHIGPTWVGLYRREVSLADGSRVLADESYLTESMMDPRAKIVSGFNPVMPTYQGLLSAPEVGALLELIKSLKNGVPEGNFPGRPLENLVAPQNGTGG